MASAAGAGAAAAPTLIDPLTENEPERASGAGLRAGLRVGLVVPDEAAVSVGEGLGAGLGLADRLLEAVGI